MLRLVAAFKGGDKSPRSKAGVNLMPLALKARPTFSSPLTRLKIGHPFTTDTALALTLC